MGREGRLAGNMKGGEGAKGSGTWTPTPAVRLIVSRTKPSSAGCNSSPLIVSGL